MANVLATGQITIIDMYDSLTLNAWISANSSINQTFNNTTNEYNPNYAVSPLILTLNLTTAGDNESLVGDNIKELHWFKTVGDKKVEINSTDSAEEEYKSGTLGTIMTSKVNTPVDYGAAYWSVEGLYYDENSDKMIPFSANIYLTVIQLAKASMIAVLSTPNGDFFRNGSPNTLRITSDVYKDGSIASTERKYKWFAADTSVIEAEDPEAGLGWRKITATSGTSGEYVNVEFDLSTTKQGVLTVFPDAVTNGQTYMNIVTDDYKGTAGSKMKQYSTLKDFDDPIMLIIDSTAGVVFKNGVGSTDLVARLYQNGLEIDQDGDEYTYKWTKWVNGEMDTTFGGDSQFKTGKTLTINSEDVEEVATFKPEVWTLS